MFLKQGEQGDHAKVLEEIMDLMDQLEAKPFAPKEAAAAPKAELEEAPQVAVLEAKKPEEDEEDPTLLEELLNKYKGLK